MNENRTPSGPRRSNGMQLLTRATGSIAPDHPPKHMHAWVNNFYSLNRILYFAINFGIIPNQ